MAEVELLGYLGVAEILPYFSVLFQQRLEVAFAAPHRHGVALHELVGVLAAGAFLGQGDQKALRMNEAAEAVEVLLHVLRVDQELVDQAREAVKGKIQRHPCIGRDYAFGRGGRGIALVPKDDSLQGREPVWSDHPPKTG